MHFWAHEAYIRLNLVLLWSSDSTQTSKLVFSTIFRRVNFKVHFLRLYILQLTMHLLLLKWGQIVHTLIQSLQLWVTLLYGNLMALLGVTVPFTARSQTRPHWRVVTRAANTLNFATSLLAVNPGQETRNYLQSELSTKPTRVIVLLA